jgi:hypothetical protein
MNPILILSIIITGTILAIVGIIVAIKKSSKPVPKKSVKKEREFDFDDLMDIVKNPKTSSNALLDALIYFNSNYKIDEENSKKYLIFLSRVLTHPNRSKNIFQYFHNEVKSKNSKFKSELENIEKKALN